MFSFFQGRERETGVREKEREGYKKWDIGGREKDRKRDRGGRERERENHIEGEGETGVRQR